EGFEKLGLPNCFEDGANFGRSAVEEHAHSVDLGGQHPDTHHRHRQNTDGQDNLIDRDGAHSDAGKHGDGGGEGDERAHHHGDVVHRTAAHAEHDHAEGNDKEHGQRHDGGVDILQLGSSGADGAVEEGIEKEAQNEEHQQIYQQGQGHVKQGGHHGIAAPSVQIELVEEKGGA